MLGQPLSIPQPFPDCCFLLLLRAGGSADPSPRLSLSPAPCSPTSAEAHARSRVVARPPVPPCTLTPTQHNPELGLGELLPPPCTQPFFLLCLLSAPPPAPPAPAELRQPPAALGPAPAPAFLTPACDPAGRDTRRHHEPNGGRMSNKSLVSPPVMPPTAPDPPLPPLEALPSTVLPWCHARVLVCAFTAGTPQAAGLKDFPIITTKSLSWAVSRRPGPFLGARLSAALCSSPPHICSSQTGFPPFPAQPSASEALRALRFHFPFVCEVSPRFQSHPHVLHTPARDRFRDSQHRPRMEAAGSPRAGDQAALPALAAAAAASA